MNRLTVSHFIGVGLLILCFCIFAFFNNAEKKHLRMELDRNHRFAIATTLGRPRDEDGRWIEYYFYFNRKTYYSSFEILPRERDFYEPLYRRHFVRFCPKNPGNAEVIRGRYIPDSVMAPKFGWEKLPQFKRK